MIGSQITDLIDAAAEALFVGRCAVCGAIGPHVVCLDCLESLELVAPPLCNRCGMPFFSADRIERSCGTCIKEEPHFDRARALFVYDEQTSIPIKLLKYSDRTAVVKPLARALVEWGIPLLGAADDYDAMLPVPLHRIRLFGRGLNQSALLTAEIARLTRLPACYDVLRRTRNTKSQTRLRPSERKKNVRGAFSPGKEMNAIAGKKLLLIDDVMTTGSTLNECARVLKKKGKAKTVDALVVARRT